MNGNINLCEILKDCPKGTKFCSYVHGEVEFVKVEPDSRCPIWASAFIRSENAHVFISFTKEGYFSEYYENQRCILVPSFEQQDWSKWECPKIDKPKFDPKTLKPFDKVLVRDHNNDLWTSIHFSYIKNDCYLVICGSKAYRYCIPYNDDTKYLIGTKNEVPEYYRYWEK